MGAKMSESARHCGDRLPTGRRILIPLAWIIGGFATEGIAICIAYLATGAGHGTSVPWLLLFPLSLPIGRHLGSVAVIGFSLILYPSYGIVLAVASRRGRALRILILIAGVHLLTGVLGIVIWGTFPSG